MDNPHVLFVPGRQSYGAGHLSIPTKLGTILGLNREGLLSGVCFHVPLDSSSHGFQRELILMTPTNSILINLEAKILERSL